jgi:ubiquinone/menaquinone biosynthesis C-methylase UbiE
MADKYLFDNAAEKEAFARMVALSALHDAATRRYIEERGIAAGWSCLEIGAGEGSIARWMAERVGPSGQVLATDIDPRFILKDLDSVPANMEVRLHDITTDPLPENTFELIHARLALIWLRDRLKVLDRLVKALRPGGWLVVEDYDAIVPRTLATADAEVAARYERMENALLTLMKERGLDGTYARAASPAAGMRTARGWNAWCVRGGSRQEPCGRFTEGEFLAGTARSRRGRIDQRRGGVGRLARPGQSVINLFHAGHDVGLGQEAVPYVSTHVTTRGAGALPYSCSTLQIRMRHVS